MENRECCTDGLLAALCRAAHVEHDVTNLNPTQQCVRRVFNNKFRSIELFKS